MQRSAVGRAPGRVNLIGEHTDYNDGLCLPLAIPQATTVRATERPDGRVRIGSAQQPEPWEGSLADCGPGRVEGWAAYAAGVVWALGEVGWAVPGLDLESESTVPLGAGLSSSASLEAAVAAAVSGLLDLELTPQRRHELVEVCRRAETEVAGAPTGGLDQTAVLLATAGCALLVDFDDGSHRGVPLPLELDELTLLVVDTRVTHALLDGGYAARRADCKAAAAALGLPSLRQADTAAVASLDDDRLRRRARHVVAENARVESALVAIAARDWSGLGKLLDASHASLRDDFEVSCPELDVAAEAAVGAGAHGARMTGGGFGGSVVALVRSARVDAVVDAVETAFAAAGFAPSQHLVVTPSGPAEVVVS
ncbi:MAG: galactokinase [Actinomycetota bacterium]|nr:galactokinase [Actinomycetota bacterium]